MQYEVIVPTLKNTTVRNLIVLDEKFKNAATNWTNYKQTLDGNVDSERTNKANKSELLFSCAHASLFNSFKYLMPLILGNKKLKMNMTYIMFEIL